MKERTGGSYSNLRRGYFGESLFYVKILLFKNFFSLSLLWRKKEEMEERDVSLLRCERVRLSEVEKGGSSLSCAEEGKGEAELRTKEP